MKFYVIENQHRPDGEINTSTTARTTFASAISFYHERYSKMAVTDLYTKVAIVLVDADLNVIEHAVITPNEGR